MNGPLRQGMQPPNTMLAIGNPSFIQNPSHPLGLPQNMNPANPPMGMLSGGPPPSVAANRYPMQTSQMPQHQHQQQRPMHLRQPQNSSQSGPPSAAHMQAQLQGMQFPGGLVQQPQGPLNTVRRVQSQPQMNPLAGMPHPVGSMMGLNQQTSMPGQIRQAQAQAVQQHQQLRQQNAMMQAEILRGQVSLPSQNMPPNMARTPSTQGQVMSSLAQPSPIGAMPHPGSTHHQNPFPNVNGGPMSSQHPHSHPHPPPQLSASPRPTPQGHTPSMSMGTPGPSHTPINRTRMTPDNANMSFMSYPGSIQQFPGVPSSRVQQANPPHNLHSSAYSSFVSSSTPPSMHMDLSQPSPGGGGNGGMMHTQGGTPNRSSFMATPAQQYELMSSTSGMDIYPPSFGMPPPAAVPPSRPPSHSTNPHQPPQQQQQPNSQQSQQQQQPTPQLQQQPQQTHHHSPPQSEQMNVHPQRPQSQPQSHQQQQQQQQIPGRPPSQTGSISRTPGAGQAPLPANAALHGPLTATGRIPINPSQLQQHQQPGMPPSGGPLPGAGPGQSMMAIAPRPPLAMGGIPPTSLPPPPASSAAAHMQMPMVVDAPPSFGPSLQRPTLGAPSLITPGQGLIRLLQFSGVLSSESKNKLQLSWWNDLVKDYFTPKAQMKLTLWKDNQRNEAKPFEIGVPILPRFFLVTTQSGVKSMSFSLDGARERLYGNPGLGHTVVECVSAIWTYKYTNGYIVTLRGPLTVHVLLTANMPPGGIGGAGGGLGAGGNAQPQYTLKFDDFQFDANLHDKYIALEYVMGSRTIENPSAPAMVVTPRPGVRNVPTPTPGGAAGSSNGNGNGQQGQGQQQQQQQMQLQQQIQMDEDRRWEEPRVLINNGSIPGEPVNAFGIPQATMRCLELAESVSSMADLIIFANETSLGPLDALKRYAARIRDAGATAGGVIGAGTGGSGAGHHGPQPPAMGMGMVPINGSMHNSNNSLSTNPFVPYPQPIGPSPSVTLYSSAPSSITNPTSNLNSPHPQSQHQPANPNAPPPSVSSSSTMSSSNSPQNTVSSVNSPEKQHKTISSLGQQQTQAHTPTTSGPASSPSVSATSGVATNNNTPVMGANTSLKRKLPQGDAGSPTVGNSIVEPAKRIPRKRGRMGTTG